MVRLSYEHTRKHWDDLSRREQLHLIELLAILQLDAEEREDE